MKKLTALALAAALVLGLAACGGSASSAGDYAAPAQERNDSAADIADDEGYDEYDDVAEEEAGEPAADGGYIYDNAEPGYAYDDWYVEPTDNEGYNEIGESPFKDVSANPLSTFSSDVDTASYSNMRRFIQNYQQPRGVRIEELVNYFEYNYEGPGQYDEDPFTITTELAACPWNEDHLLAMIGIQGEELTGTEDIANNVVFLIDVSGSMNYDNKLPLLQDSFVLLLSQLGANDRVSIVTYAGSDKVLAEGVRGNKTAELSRIIKNLSAGGSTAGAKGLQTAYELAESNFIEGGNNRVILATDGDFNVGISSEEGLIALIEEERDKGIYISVLGYGMGNYKDNLMEAIADNGNGNYAYIDNLGEAKKVLVDEFDSMMYTIAQDLKLQVEFNPSTVSQYRLIGYDNRRMADRDFNNDAKDAGDIGAGHSVTAFYEIVPATGSDPMVDDLIYGTNTSAGGSADFMTVKVRYKKPGESESNLVQQAVGPNAFTLNPSQDFAFASAVAEFGLILTDSDYRADASLTRLMARADSAMGEDPYGLREEFIELVDAYRMYID